MQRTTSLTEAEMQPQLDAITAANAAGLDALVWLAQVEMYRRRRFRNEPDDAALVATLHAQIPVLTAQLGTALAAALVEASDHPLDT
jgi:hypothetical protein